jgi:hypothetical protein
MQSEILFIAKFGGLCVSVLGYLFWIVKPMAVFNERQKQNKADIDELKSIKDEFIKLKTEHEVNKCRRTRKND